MQIHNQEFQNLAPHNHNENFQKNGMEEIKKNIIIRQRGTSQWGYECIYKI
jgi:hypothetical protein